MAMDRQSIIDNVAKADQLPAVSFTPKGMPGWDVFHKSELLKPTADKEGAKKLLADAGFPMDRGLREIVIYYNTSEGHQAIATAVKISGSRSEPTSPSRTWSGSQYLDFLPNNDDVMVYRMGWVADFNDAYNFPRDSAREERQQLHSLVQRPGMRRTWTMLCGLRTKLRVFELYSSASRSCRTRCP